MDNLRYDAAKKRLYVGYEDEKTGAIGMVDVTTNKRLDDKFKLGAHPESFQLSASGPNIYGENFIHLTPNMLTARRFQIPNRALHVGVPEPLLRSTEIDSSPK